MENNKKQKREQNYREKGLENRDENQRNSRASLFNSPDRQCYVSGLSNACVY